MSSIFNRANFLLIAATTQISAVTWGTIHEGFFEVAIEGWSEWDLNPRPLNSVQTL